MNLTISLAQINVIFGSPEANLEQARTLIAEASRRGSQIILFPELWTTGYDLTNARRLAQVNRALLAETARLAQDFSLYVGGSLLLAEGEKVFNTFVLQSPDGGEPADYSKIHLFRLMEEDRWLTPGDHLQQVALPWGKTGLSICYDLRFPEMYRRYALDGARLFLISAEWPTARIRHWQTLLRARAIENQCFIAASNCTGDSGGETFGGGSAVISPWGEALTEASSEQPELLTVSIDLDQSEEIRRQIPILHDRRPDIYG